MGQLTICSVQPFESERGYIKAGRAYEASSPSIAKHYAESRIDGNKTVGAIAIAQTGDPQLGEWDEPEILGIYGVIPDGVLDQ